MPMHGWLAMLHLRPPGKLSARPCSDAENNEVSLCDKPSGGFDCSNSTRRPWMVFWLLDICRGRQRNIYKSGHAANLGHWRIFWDVVVAVKTSVNNNRVESLLKLARVFSKDPSPSPYFEQETDYNIFTFSPDNTELVINAPKPWEGSGKRPQSRTSPGATPRLRQKGELRLDNTERWR